MKFLADKACENTSYASVQSVYQNSPTILLAFLVGVIFIIMLEH